MRYIVTLLLLMSKTTMADQSDCLSAILHAEAQGEPVTGVIAVAEASVNRASRQKKNVCNITGVQRKRPPKAMESHYKAIASNVLRLGTNTLAKGADSWDRRLKVNGMITARIGNHTFYKSK
jgi:hypothetical protein